jgi:sugar/nucleoside kinase (ribokinase family)
MDSLHARDGRELVRIYAEAGKTGVTTSMDISLPDPNSAAGKADWPTIYKKTLPFVDIFVPSIEEAFFTLNPREWARRREKSGGEELVERIRPDEFSAIASRFLDMGCAIVVLKAGPNGWYLRTASAARLGKMGRLKPRNAADWANVELWCPAFEARRIAGATGSGDTSIAGFLAAMLRGKSPVACLKMANCAGWMNLRAMDALSGLCSWRKMEKALPRLQPRDAPILRNAGWKWLPSQKIWKK